IPDVGNESWHVIPQFSPDGRIIVTSAWEERHYCLWDVATGKFLRKLTLNDRSRPYPGSTAISPDGRLFALADRQRSSGGREVSRVSLFEVATGNARTHIAIPKITIPGEKKGELRIPTTFSPDGRWLFVRGSQELVISVKERKIKARQGHSQVS